MRKIIKKVSKKAAALVAAGAVGLTLAMPVAAPTAEAGVGEAIGAAITIGSIASQRAAIRKEVEQLENTEEGRQALFLSYQQQTGVNNDYYLNQKLQTIMNNLTRGVAAVDPSINDKPYLWYVSADQSFNAACSFGHVMMVNTGLFNYLATDDEIAAVVGHEMGHGQKGHVKKGVLKSIDRNFVISLGAAAAGGSALTNLAASVTAIHLDAHSTKKDEWEADNMSFEYLKNTNYNLGAGAAAFQKMVELTSNYKQSGLEKIFNPSDHPNSDARRDNHIKKLAEYSGANIDMKEGTVTINKKMFVTPAPTETMSSAERACFVLGNLAAAYHNGHASSSAYLNGNVVMLGGQPIMTIEYGDESGEVLVNRLNSIK